MGEGSWAEGKGETQEDLEAKPRSLVGPEGLAEVGGHEVAVLPPLRESWLKGQQDQNPEVLFLGEVAALRPELEGVTSGRKRV
ncbi:hypothetical protein QT17_12640 [Thermus sp. 2.9]|nr:hypothetical protein QT17_12640 [Thermus sp. 2.9]